MPFTLMAESHPPSLTRKDIFVVWEIAVHARYEGKGVSDSFSFKVFHFYFKKKSTFFFTVMKIVVLLQCSI
jgi:hypothetical protein